MLRLRHSSFPNPPFASPTSQALLILQTFRHFTYVTIQSPILPSLYLRHSSFSNPSVASSTSQFILQPFFASPTSQTLLILQPFRHLTYVTTHSPALRRFTYATANSQTLPLLHLRHNHSPTLPSLYLRHSSFSNTSVVSPTSQFILHPSFRFSYVRRSAHSPNFPSFRLRHNSFSNPSVTSPTSQLVFQPFHSFTYVTAHSPILPLRHLRIVHSPTFLSLLLLHKLCSFSKLSVTSPTSQVILQHIRYFTYATVHSPTLLWLLLRHKLFT